MLVNSITQQWIDAFCSRPQAAVFIDAEYDFMQGTYILREIYNRIITDNSPLIVIDLQDKTSIGIEEIRSLQQKLSMSANKSTGISRIAAIYNAHTLTTEAQNALLKLIEELPERTIIGLVGSKRNILPTVASRCFTIPVLPISREMAITYAEDKGITEAETLRAFTLSDGYSSIFEAILSGNESSFIESITETKSFLQSTPYERQKMLAPWYKEKSTAEAFLQSLEISVKAAMRHATSTSQKHLWKSKLRIILRAKELLAANVSAKLVLLNVSVSI